MPASKLLHGDSGAQRPFGEAESAFVDRFIEQATDPASGWGRMWAELSASPL